MYLPATGEEEPAFGGDVTYRKKRAKRRNGGLLWGRGGKMIGKGRRKNCKKKRHKSLKHRVEKRNGTSVGRGLSGGRGGGLKKKSQGEEV